jgi:prepilin-type N-terminal cleavage/methylation domain-containing protein
LFFLRSEQDVLHNRALSNPHPHRSIELSVRKGFSLLELLAVLGLLCMLATLSFPAFRSLLHSGSRRTAETRVMDSLEHARSEAIASGRNVWVVFRHAAAEGPDAGRLLAETKGSIVPLGAWQRLPAGITFRAGSGGIPDARPPLEIMEAATHPRSDIASMGAVMFLRSGSVGWPKPGAESLAIPLDSPSGRSLISLSRATGRATLAFTAGEKP